MSLSARPETSTAGEASQPARVLLISGAPSGNQPMQQALADFHCKFDCVATDSEALREIQATPYAVVITDPCTTIKQDLALVEEARKIRPNTRIIILAALGTREEILGALRQSVFLCKCAPFSLKEIARYAVSAIEQAQVPVNFEVLSAHLDWITVRMNCHMLNAERLVEYFKQLHMNLAEQSREELMSAFREILTNAIEHGAGNDPTKLVQVSAVRTARSVVFYISDPGKGFRRDAIPHSALSNKPDDPAGHLEIRERSGMRPGGYGLLLVKGIVDELIYNEPGNEVLLIKYMPNLRKV
jgi:anti-sigma regulatory factor (Ser/Thr protein kinase)